MVVFIGGKERRCHCNSNLALEEYTKRIDFKTTYSEIYAIVYGSLYAGDYLEREGKGECSFTFSDVMQWVDEADNETITKICNAFAETQKYKEWLSAFTDKVRALAGADKKKATKKKVA